MTVPPNPPPCPRRSAASPETSAGSSTAERVPTRSLHGIGLGAVAEWTMNGAVANLVMPIYTTGFGLNPVLVSWAVTIPRFVDAITDPPMGHWTDRTRTRWGRRKPFLVAGAILSALLTMAMWWASPAWSETGQFAYLLAVSVCFWLAYTVYTIPSMALGFEVSPEYYDRVRVTTARSLYCVVPGLAVGWVYWLALRPEWGGEINGIRMVSILVAAVVLGCGLAPVFLVRERFATRAAPSQSIWRAVRETTGNRHFRYFMLIVIVLAMGNAIFQGLIFYVNAYWVCGGDKVLATKIIGVSSTLSTLMALATVPFAPWIGRRFGKRAGLCLGAGLYVLYALVQPWLLRPEQPWLQVWGALLVAPAGAFFGAFLGSFLADICDLDDAEYGHRREGMFGSVYNFVKKIEISACALITGYLLAFAKFDVALPMQTPETLATLRWLTFAPYIVLTGLTLLLVSRFPVTRAIAETARVAIQERTATAHPAGR